MMSPSNINTPNYWTDVYRREWKSGAVQGSGYHRDYSLIHDAIVGLIDEGSRVLDVGCGPGLLCRKIRQRVPHTKVIGVDFSEYVIAQNQERDVSLGIVYHQLDVRTALPLLEGPFDVVTMCEVLEHLEQPESVVSSAMKLLKPGGRFILTCPHDDEVPDPEHLRSWGHDEVFHLLAPHSDTVSFMHFPLPYFHTWMLAYLTKGQDGSGREGRQ